MTPERGGIEGAAHVQRGARPGYRRRPGADDLDAQLEEYFGGLFKQLFDASREAARGGTRRRGAGSIAFEDFLDIAARRAHGTE